MTNPTSNFGWQMPTSTDLVTDLPADFEVFGQAVDTDFVDLLGGTTGQVLSKTSATDLDFTWINNDTGDITGVTAGTGISGGGTSGTVTVTNSMATEITAKGDLIVGTGNATFDNLPVGSNAQILVADSTASTGLKWATPAGGGKVLQVVSGTSATLVALSSTTYTDTNVTATITPTSATSKIMVLIMFSFAITAVVDGNSHGGFIKLFRDSTAILTNTRALLLSSPSGGVLIQQLTPVNYYDSPATTSATTYKLQMACDASSTTIYSQIANMPSGILLLEIGA